MVAPGEGELAAPVRQPNLLGRAALLLPALLALWWFVLRGASLTVLRWVALLPLGLLVAPGGSDPLQLNPDTGEWVFSVEVEGRMQNRQTGALEPVHAIEFAAEPASVEFFACGWFSYLALALAAHGLRKPRLLPLLKGLALQTVVNVACLVAYVYINGHGMLVNTPGGGGSLVWWLQYVYHLIYLVVPFAGPFVIALLSHPEWRTVVALPLAGATSSSGR